MTMTEPTTVDYGNLLREVAVGCRLSKTRWGVRKALPDGYKEEAASIFGADADFLSASSKLIDTKNKRYKEVSSVFSQATTYWKRNTLPFPEPGVRLLKRELVSEFEDRMSSYQSSLDGAVTLLQRDYSVLLEEARSKRGRLFCISDYPSTLDGLFSIKVEYPAIQPDESLKTVNARLYEREAARIQARFQEAVSAAEQEFAAEFQRMLGKICETLAGLNDGTAKQFSQANLDNLGKFFDRFRDMNIGSSEALDKLVEDAKAIVSGYQPEWFEASEPLRNVVGKKLAAVEEQVVAMMVKKPKRKITFGDD